MLPIQNCFQTLSYPTTMDFFFQKIGYLVIKGKVFPAAVKPHNSTPAYMVIQIVKCKTMGKTIFPHSGKR